MYQDDFYNPVDQNYYDVRDDEKMFDKIKRQDRGYNCIYRKALKRDGTTYNKKIEVYASSGSGNRIRDAETGQYLNYKVGSENEDLFFKVTLATGELTGSHSTLYYNSPQHYANHTLCNVNQQIASDWEKKRDARLKSLLTDKERYSLEVR